MEPATRRRLLRYEAVEPATRRRLLRYEAVEAATRRRLLRYEAVEPTTRRRLLRYEAVEAAVAVAQQPPLCSGLAAVVPRQQAAGSGETIPGNNFSSFV